MKLTAMRSYILLAPTVAAVTSSNAHTLYLYAVHEVAMNVRNASKMLSTYNVTQWGNSYYDVNEKGKISVCPNFDFPQERRRFGGNDERV
ncbi:MAG: hypothetical protein G5663_07695 [Serratia symbiotica]|nr:hypothetical protein [Serratia symbiotica]